MIIKKLNSIFHRHSRWLFGLFTIIIIVSFIGFMVPGSFFGFGPDTGSSARVGTAFGKKVTYDDLRLVHRNLEVCNQIGFPVGDSRIEQQFFFYCLLLKAEEMGIAASDKEVAESLKNHPMLQTDGKFDKQKYTNMINNLSRLGISKQDILESIRMVLVITKLQNQLGASIIATPGEAKELYRQFNTSYELKIAEIQTPAAPKLVKPDAKKLSELPAAEQKAVAEFFRNNSRNYTIPGWMDVLAVEFKHNLFTAQAAKKATAAELQKFYTANPTLFHDKNGKLQPFAAVKDKVRSELIRIESADLAQRAAEDFSIEAADAAAAVDKQADKIKSFRDAADKRKLTVAEVSKVPFTASSVGTIISRELVQALDQCAGNPVTKVVNTSDSACVAFLRNRTETRPAKLDEVLKTVRADKVKNDLYLKAKKSAEAAFVALRKLPKSQQAKAFDSLKDAKFTTLKFTLSDQAPDPKFQQAVEVALGMRPGEISSPLPNLQLVRLISRKAPDYKGYTGKESQYLMIVRMQKARQLQAAFMEELSTQCRLDPSLMADRK